MDYDDIILANNLVEIDAKLAEIAEDLAFTERRVLPEDVEFRTGARTISAEYMDELKGDLAALSAHRAEMVALLG
jgi:hypothetical protein